MTISPRLPASLTIDSDKISLYLLNPASRDGEAKAKYLLSYGFSLETPDVLAQALFEHTTTAALQKAVDGAYGRRFVFEGPLRTPKGLTGRVRTVWEVRTDEETARLLTAYPC